MPLRRESLTHSERAQRGRIGAYVMHARHDARSTTAAARQAFGRLRRAEAARSAYFVQLAYRSAVARRRARRPNRAG